MQFNTFIKTLNNSRKEEKQDLLRAGWASEAAVRGLHLHQGETPEGSSLEVFLFQKDFQDCECLDD